MTKEECLSTIGQEKTSPSYFGPERDLGAPSLCWSFAGTALIEEELCLEKLADPTLNYECGQSLSPIDASRCEWEHWNLAKKIDEGTKWKGGKYALDCFLKQNKGICLEKDAPYTANGFDVKLAETLKQKYRPNCATNQKHLNGTEKVADQMNYVADIFNILKNRYRFLDLPPADILRGDDTFRTPLLERLQDPNEIQSLLAEKRTSAYLTKALLPVACQVNRIQPRRKLNAKVIAFEKIPRGGENAFFKPELKKIKLKIQAIRKVFENGRSVTLGICSLRIMGQDGQECGDHDIVASNWRWNSEQNRCEIFLRNSQGPGSFLSGWQDIEKVLGNTYSASFLDTSQLL